jgi:hypothetical protein
VATVQSLLMLMVMRRRVTSEGSCELAAVTEAEIEARTAAVRSQIESRHQRGGVHPSQPGKPQPPKPVPATASGATPGPTRSLVDPNALRLRDAKGRVVGTLGASRRKAGDLLASGSGCRGPISLPVQQCDTGMQRPQIRYS